MTRIPPKLFLLAVIVAAFGVGMIILWGVQRLFGH